ncbi:MAG: dockerin type I domain-containing protein [candidate division Zixibacteria bacterium]
MLPFYRAIIVLMAIFYANPTLSVGLLNEPEGIVFDSMNNRYLVSNWRSGTVVEINSAGEQSYFKTGLGNCASIIIDGDVVYVAVNNNGVIGLDLATGATLMSVNFAGAGGCHGLAADTSGYVYATDWRNSRIYRVDLSDNSYSVFANAGKGVNSPLGIHFDPFRNRLIMASMTNNFPIQALNLSDTTVSALISPSLPPLDGIARDHMGNYYISTMASNSPGSNNNNSIYRFDSTFSQRPQLIISGLDGHTDIYFTSHNNILAAVIYWDHDVIYLPIYGYTHLNGYTFSDDLYGDGDGIPEGGETVELVCQISNRGVDTIVDLSVNLFSNDAALRIIDGSTVIGDVLEGHTVDNEGDPFIIEIPNDYIPRFDSLYFETIWQCDTGTVTNTLAGAKNIGAASILLVNDDGGSGVDGYYISCLQAAHIPYDIWSSPPSPSSEDLNGYDIVIWFVGDYQTSPLDNDEVSAMKGFLDAGGQLFLTGQGIAAQLDTDDQSFLHDYLHAGYVATSFVPILASAGGQVFDISDSIYIQGSGGAANQVAPDHLAAINGGVDEYRYLVADNPGAVSYLGTYKVIFFGFGFEAIINGDSRWTGRGIIMDKILDFFAYQRPQSTISLAVAPGDPIHMTEHTPELSWSHSDAEFVQQEYHVQVSNDDDWSMPEMWDSGPISGSETSLVYAGTALSDGSTYYYRVRVSNGITWSYWYYSEFRMNSIPASPTNLDPDNMQELEDNPPTLSHANSQDNEGDSLTYSYEVYDDELLTELIVQASGIPEGDDGMTTWELPDTIPNENDYFWRALAYDGFEYGGWSQVATFYILAPYFCGDANGDTETNVGDAVFIINHIFKSGPVPDPIDACDSNCDGQCNVGDAVYMINHVFKGGPGPCAGCE